MDRLRHLIRFYSIVDVLKEGLGSSRKLAECSGRMNWPERGVYFFWELGEHRSDSGKGLRIVRVGTHAIKTGSATTLWNRLSQHRGQLSTGSGNHRGSIFRLIVGSALIKRHTYHLPSWGTGNTAKADLRSGERALEREVSDVIGAMPFIWLAIDDDAGPSSARGYIERNSIALLSNFNKMPLDPPSEHWLGRDSDRERVRNSGLWNQNHTTETYDPFFLDTLDRIVSEAGHAA